MTLLFAIAESGSAAAGMGGASGWAGGIDGESAGRTTVLGAGWYPASSGFAETAQAGLLRTENYFPVVFGSRRDDPTLITGSPGRPHPSGRGTIIGLL